MIDETTRGAAASSASHCAAKSSGAASPASGGTGGPHCPRKSRTRASCSAIAHRRRVGDPQIDLEAAVALAAESARPRRRSRRARSSARRARPCRRHWRPPRPARPGRRRPSAPCRIGTRSPKRRQKASARSSGLFDRGLRCCGIAHSVPEIPATCRAGLGIHELSPTLNRAAPLMMTAGELKEKARGR